MSSIYNSICGLEKNSVVYFDESTPEPTESRLDGEEWSTSCTSSVMQRYTVGDFDVLPPTLAVDEDRCDADDQYRQAMNYISLVTPNAMSKRFFNKDRRYRDAINLLVGVKVPLSSFNENSSANGGFKLASASSSENRPSCVVHAKGLRILEEDKCSTFEIDEEETLPSIKGAWCQKCEHVLIYDFVQ